MLALTIWLALPVAAMRVGLGLLFLRNAWSKSRDLAGFVAIVANYRLLPEGLVRPVAALVLAAEAVLAALLVAGVLAPVAGYGSAGLLAVFALAMTVNLLRGRTDISCGCLPAAIARRHLSWRGMAGTAALIIPAMLSAQGWRLADMASMMQADFAGLLLFSLHDAAIRLAASPAARQKS